MSTWHRARFCKRHMIKHLHKPRSLGSNEASLCDALERAQEERWCCITALTYLGIFRSRYSSLPRQPLAPPPFVYFSLGRRLCEYYSEKVRFHARVKYDGHDADLHKPRDDAKPAHPLLKAVSTVTANSVYNGGKNTDLLSVHDIAARCREGSVTSESMVLTWHIHATDLVLLRRLFEEAGYDDILPPDNNCIPMIPQFRKNLPTTSGNLVTAKLEVLFPPLCLRGMNSLVRSIEHWLMPNNCD
jgi:hypothetical protein